MASTIAKAYVQIVPSTQGMASDIKDALNSGGYDDVGESIGGKISKGLSNSILGAGIGGMIGGVIGGALEEAVSKAVSSVGDVIKSSIFSGADFEQLAGGMEKIFSGMDTSKILSDAKNAYKELGMSVNEYLEKVNDVGASFKATMGDEKGYETARKGMMAISDYATGTGKDLGTLSEKFGMITRSTSSYQSIADQFSGILPATSAEFLKQSQAAGTLSSSYNTLSDVPIGEYQQAVAEALQSGTRALNLQGNTAKEASTTFSGSLQQMKSAWENLKTSFTSEELDTGEMTSKFIEAFKEFIEQLAPMLEEMAPSIVEAFSIVAEELGPVLTELLINVMTDLASRMPEIVGRINKALIDAIASNLGLDGIGDAIGNSIMNGIRKAVQMVRSAKNLFAGIGDSIKDAFSNISIGDIANNLKQKLSGLKDTFSNLFQGIDLSGIGQSLSEMFGRIAESARNAVENIKSITTGMWNNISEGLSGVIGAVREKISSIAEAVKEGLNSAANVVSSWGQELASKAQNAIKEMGSRIVTALKEIPQKLKQAGQEMAAGMINGFTENFQSIASKPLEVVQNLVDKIKKVLGIHSPSRLMRDEVGAMMAKGLEIGWSMEMSRINAGIDADIQKEYSFGQSSIIDNIRNQPKMQPNQPNMVDALSRAMQNITVQNNVTLEGDAGKLFSVMQNKNRTFKNTTGRSAFA